MKKTIQQPQFKRTDRQPNENQPCRRAKQKTNKNISDFFAFPYTDSQNGTLHCFTNTADKEDLFLHSPVQKVNDKSKALIWCYSITPVHLKNLDIICKIFGRSRYTVKQWAKEGAPIVYDGVSYISEYNALFSWLLDFYREKTWQ